MTDVELIARTLFASRAVAFSPYPVWDQEPNPLRDECWDDARDVSAALAALPRGMDPETVEACAKVCEKAAAIMPTDRFGDIGKGMALDLADNIRALLPGKPEERG